MTVGITCGTEAKATFTLETGGQASTRGAWIVLWTVLLASVAAAFNQYKVPALLPILMQSFGVDLVDAAWLVSAFSVTGVLLALPSGLILYRLGSRTTGIAGLGFVLAGCLMGSVPLGINVFLASRVVEGVGLGLVVVVSPALIAEWFPPACRGLPMGIYAIWLPVGAVLAFSVAPGLAGVGGWELAWWAGAAVSLVAIVVYIVMIHGGRPLLDADRTDSALDLRVFFANRDIWLLSAAFTCACIAMGEPPWESWRLPELASGGMRLF